jgi:hypothetical protein
VLVVSLAALLAAAAAGAKTSRSGAAAKAKPRTVTCHARAGVSEELRLAGGRKIKARRVHCSVARKVAKSFGRRCEKAYAGQGRCKLRAGGRRWTCKSRIVGPLSKGAPSRETCRAKRSRLTFVIALAPLEPDVHALRPAAAPSGPYDEANDCIETNNPGRVVPPASGATFEIHLWGDVPLSLGEQLQTTLITHRVMGVLRYGLDTLPRNTPNRIWMFLTPGPFNAGESHGFTGAMCSNPSVGAILVNANRDPAKIARTAAHELYHAYSIAGTGTAYYGAPPWWEETAATWSVTRSGFPEEIVYDVALQYPNQPLDQKDMYHEYGMARFIQLLEDRGLIGEDEWPLMREVLGGYKSPGATRALADAVAKRHKVAKPLGDLLAQFWADRLRQPPSHGTNTLVPADGDNARGILVKPGNDTITATAKPLRTELLDIRLEPKVARVEFEFDPRDGFFSGRVDTNDVRRFERGDSVSFCVGKADRDDLEWPKNLPVLFTNGNLQGAQIQGEITVRASTDAEQCSAPAPNRGCRLLKGARVESVLGDGSFPFSSEHEDAHVHQWLCFYEGSSGEARLDLARHKTDTVKEVRETVKKIIAQLNLDPIDIGDVGGIGQIDGGDKVTGVLVFSVKREIALLMVGPGAHHADLITLGKRMAGALD